MLFEVRLKHRAEKELKRVPERNRFRILYVLRNISKNPLVGKKLEGEYSGYYCIRSWPYRIIYKIFKEKRLIIIIRIGHRQGVYK